MVPTPHHTVSMNAGLRQQQLQRLIGHRESKSNWQESHGARYNRGGGAALPGPPPVGHYSGTPVPLPPQPMGDHEVKFEA